MRRPACLLLLSIAVGGGHQAYATGSNFDQKLFGHDVKVNGSGPEQTLTVDGKQFLADAFDYIFIDHPAQVDGSGVLIGSLWGSGTACDPSPFILVLPMGKPARLDTIEDRCGTGNINVRANAIEYDYPPLPNKLGHRYSWTPGSGFSDLGETYFEPDSKLGWTDLKRDGVKLPIDLYKYAPVAAALKNLTGPNDAIFINGLLGPGSGRIVDDIYEGSACVAHNCAGNGSFVILQIDKRAAYLAWKEDDKPFVVRPKVSAWPSAFRKKLKAWTEELSPSPRP